LSEKVTRPHHQWTEAQPPSTQNRFDRRLSPTIKGRAPRSVWLAIALVPRVAGARSRELRGSPTLHPMSASSS